MRTWYFTSLACLCLVQGCTKATIDPSSREQEAPIGGKKGEDAAGIVVAQFGQEHCQAKVGQAVHFPFSFVVVPSMMIYRLKVAVNGEAIRDPELASPQDGPPGAGKITYVFRPKQRGSYEVEVIPVYEFGDGAGGTWIVDVSD